MLPNKANDSSLHRIEGQVQWPSLGAYRGRVGSQPDLPMQQAGLLVNRPSYQMPMLSQVPVCTALMFILAGMALYFPLMRVGELRQAVDALRYVRWVWLIPAALCASMTELAAVLSLSGALNDPLAFQLQTNSSNRS